MGKGEGGDLFVVPFLPAQYFVCECSWPNCFCLRSLVPGFLSSLVDSALRLPVAIERRLSRNEENRGGGETTNGREERSFGEFLRAVSTVSRKNSRREEEEEWEAGFTGEEREMEGLVDR